MEVPIPSHPRRPNLFSPLVVLLATLAVAGCNSTPAPQADGLASVSFAIASGDVLPAGSGGASVERILSASAFSYSEVTQIRINIWETGNQSQPLYVNFDLLLEAGDWTGRIPFLPKNKTLVFSAQALNEDAELLFQGSTEQTLSTNQEDVVISLSAANDGRTISIPRIKKITVPSAFSSGQSGNVTSPQLHFEIRKGSTPVDPSQFLAGNTAAAQ